MAVANEREDESEILPLIDGVGGFGFPYIHFHDASSLFLSPLAETAARKPSGL